jgi:hypothetical protein
MHRYLCAYVSPKYDTSREDEREEDHEEVMQEITKRVRLLKEETTQKGADLEQAQKSVNIYI